MGCTHRPSLSLRAKFLQTHGSRLLHQLFFFSFFHSFFFTSLIPVCLDVEGNNVTQTEEMWTTKSPPSGWLAGWLAQAHTDSPTTLSPPSTSAAASPMRIFLRPPAGQMNKKKKKKASAASRTFTLPSFHSNKRALTGLELGWLSQPSPKPSPHPHYPFFSVSTQAWPALHSLQRCRQQTAAAPRRASRGSECTGSEILDSTGKY